MPAIRAIHIENLAQQTAGRDRAGELLRRLIYCWSPNRVGTCLFLANEVNNFPGWDGVVHLKADGPSTEHFSLWQLSVERSAEAKIKRDFQDSLRADLPPGWLRQSTTYVAVTLRKLSNRAKLENDLRQQGAGHWSDVRIVDAIALEHWIELCAPVESWASEEFGLGLGQFGSSLERSWKPWSESTVPAIATDLLTAGRDVVAVRDALQTLAAPFSIQADSPEEAMALIYAVVQSLDTPRREALLLNALVVSSETRARAYVEQPIRSEMAPLTILMPPATTQANLFLRKGHLVVMAFGRKKPNSSSTLVRRALRSDFEAALKHSMQVSAPEALTQARACGSSVSIWRVWNLLRTASIGDSGPIWSRDTPSARLVVPAVLARAWDEAVSGDQEVIQLLSGAPYNQYRDSIHTFLTSDVPLHERAGSVTSVVAPTVAYALVGHEVTDGQFDAYEKAARLVFGTTEPEVNRYFDEPDAESSLADEARGLLTLDSRWSSGNAAQHCVLDSVKAGRPSRHGSGLR